MSAEPEEYPWADFFAVSVCDHCDERMACALLQDPFIAEVYPENDNPPSMWCHSCYRAALDEI